MWRKPVGLGAMRTRTLIRRIVGAPAHFRPTEHGSARTDGIETMNAVAARKIATLSQSVWSIPITAETGPASAIPTGISTNEPSAS